MSTRVAITGIGLVSPLGNDRESTWKSILEGRSGVGPVTRFDSSRHDTRIAAEVKDFDPLNYIDRKLVRRTDRFIQFALAAAKQAMEDSGWILPRCPTTLASSLARAAAACGRSKRASTSSSTSGPTGSARSSSRCMASGYGLGAISRCSTARAGTTSPRSRPAQRRSSIGEACGGHPPGRCKGDDRRWLRGQNHADVAGGLRQHARALAATTTIRRRQPSLRQRARRLCDGRRRGRADSRRYGYGTRSWREIYAEIIGYCATADAHHVTEPAPGRARGWRGPCVAR